MHPATIGPFTIERELGRGGMGEVYLALDTRLDRKAPEFSTPTKLFDVKSSGPFAMTGWSGYGVLPDGGFVMMERADWEREAPVIHVMLNWAQELEGKAATK
jgi:hypothetical protein